MARGLRMLERLGRWTVARADRIADVYLVRARDAVSLYVVSKAEAYDFPLGQELTEFAAPYLARGILDSVALVPASSPEELEAYFDPNRAFRVTFE